MTKDFGAGLGVVIHNRRDAQQTARSRTLNRLPARAVHSTTATGKYSDGGGLYLVVTSSGSKNWAMRYRFEGKDREAGLGSARDVSLADARIKAAEFRASLARGEDPLAVRPKAATPLFADIADQYIRDQEARWRSAKSRTAWFGTLRDHAHPILAKPVDAITAGDMLTVLRPIWQAKPETASKLRGRIERVLDAAIALGHRHDNPARWKGGLAATLPPPKKLTRGHHSAMRYADIPGFVAQLRQREAVSARLLEFIILTAARSGEARAATWAEINLEARIWTVPAARMKAGKEHRVPLTDRAVDILAVQKVSNMAGSMLVFPSDAGREQSVNVFAALFRRMSVDGVTTHGFRSSFRDWAGDETEHPRELIEAALAHAVGNTTERAYRRSDALVRRRKLMEDWAAFCAGANAYTKGH